MKQVIRKGFRDIIVDEVPEPLVTPNHVLIAPVYSLISSGTETADIHQEAVIKEVAEDPSKLKQVLEVMKTNSPIRTASEVLAKFGSYAALGYSGAGVLIDVHETVSGLMVGDRVAYGGEGTGHAETVITGKNLVARIPENVQFQHACFTTLGSIALNSVRIAEIGIGDTVAVVGLGIVGQLCAQLVNLSGGVAIGMDLIPDRVEMALQMGAEHGIIADESAEEKILSLTDGKGVDSVIVAAAAKSAQPSKQALRICRDRGRLVIVGAVDLHFPWDEMYMKEIKLFMSRAYGPGSYDEKYEKQGHDYPYSYIRWTEKRNMEEFLRLVSKGQVRIEPLITHRFPLEEAEQAYQTIMDPASSSLAILLEYPASDEQADPTAREAVRKVTVEPATGTEDSTLRVALVGAGNIVRWAHLPSIKKIPGVVLHAVYSSSGVRGKSYGVRYKVNYCTTDYERILGDTDIDIALIASRHQYHGDQAVAALKAGKHVFIEKPMALTEEECVSIYHAAEESGKLLAIGFNRRFAPCYAGMKRQLSRYRGPVVINCRINSPGISGDYWAADPSIGGAILGEAVHFIDLMYWLIESEPVGVTAFSLPLDKESPIGQNNIVSSFSFADGSIGNFTYCTVGGKASQGEKVEVFFEGGSIMAEDFKSLIIRTKTKRRLQSRIWPAKGYHAQMKSFISSVRNGEQPEVTVWDGARATIGALRMIESAKTMQPCSIDVAAVLQRKE